MYGNMTRAASSPSFSGTARLLGTRPAEAEEDDEEDAELNEGDFETDDVAAGTDVYHCLIPRAQLPDAPFASKSQTSAVQLQQQQFAHVNCYSRQLPFSWQA